MYRFISDNDSEEGRPQNPRINANVFKIFTNSWLLSLLKIGQNRDLNENDLYKTLDDYSSSLLGSELEKIWKSELTNAFKVNRKPSLLRALIQMFGVKYMFYGFLACVNEMIFKILQPILIGKLLVYFNPIGSNTVNLEGAFICASGLLLSMLTSAILHRSISINILCCSMKIRVACCSLIFRKVLCLSHSSLGKITIGRVINLVSNEVNKFGKSLSVLHYLWIGPLQTILVTYLLWSEIGIFTLLGVATFFIFIPFQGWLGKKISTQRLKTVNKTDERISLMNEIISGIKLIKMYTWEKSFVKLIEYARRKEIQQIRKLSYLRMILTTFKDVQIKFQLCVIIISYVLFGNHISAQKVYVTISFYTLLSSTMTSWFPLGLAGIADLQVTIKRIQELLLLEEKDCLMSNISKSDQEVTKGVIELNYYDKLPKSIIGMGNTSDQLTGLSIDIFNATAKWTDVQTSNSLENINLTVESGELVTIIGPVGAGKSSLMQLILRELPLLRGRVSVHGMISYASQESWLFSGSVQQNILFGSQMNIERYKQVIEICALKNDLEEFPHGDKTIVGERGVTLSGGQRARINLARAVYKQADIYLLDDPLSALDAHVGKYVFEKCIKNYLKAKTCLLVTHQLHYLTNVDQIVLLENANISAKGTYQELQASSFDFVKLIESSEETSNGFDDKAINKNSLCSNTHSLHNISSNVVESKQNGIITEPKEKDKIHSSVYIPKNVYVSYLSAGGNMCQIIFFFCMFLFTQTMTSGGDYWLGFWVNQEELNLKNLNNISLENSTLMARDSSNFVMLSTNICQICILVYAILTICMIIGIHIRSVSSVSFCMRASINLHNNMFNTIIRSTLQYFNLTSSGQIFNSFSNDIGAIDDVLPYVICDNLQVHFRILGIVFIVSLVNTYLIIPTFIIGVICYLIKKFIMPTSQSLKRLTSKTQSPLLAHINTSLQGLTTVRAFQVEEILSNEFNKHQDLHSAADYLLLSVNHALSAWLEMVCLIYISFIVFSFLIINNNFSGGFVGLAITQSVRLVLSVQWGIKQLAELENQIHSVERVLEYMNIPQESNIESSPDKAPPKLWPKSGEIIFQNFSLRYSPDLPYTLNNLNLRIQSMEKVGIVGRTGAGKSSIISALFRLAFNEGIILIDGIEIHDLGLHDLRSKLSIIPQEPVLFEGTIRTNLDPFDEYPDHVIWKALDEVEFKVVIENLLGGLNSKVSENGSNFSVGQRQLLCLARAIIQNNKILILDEATANVDPQTDALIQITIRNTFRMCTVLTIAHRLNTIMDSDKVFVMDAGSIVEFDHPHNLLKNKDGVFFNMVEQTGQADLLKSVAAESFMTMQMKIESPN